MELYIELTAAEFTALNPVLGLEVEGFETDTKKTKFGDGITTWNSLGYTGLLQIRGHLEVDPDFFNCCGAPIMDFGSFAIPTDGLDIDMKTFLLPNVAIGLDFCKY